MASSPNLKVFSPKGEYVASCKYLTDAAILVGYNGNNGKVKLGHNGIILWNEGHEEIPASESFDRAVEIMASRIGRGS